jgi:DNA-binding Xre family transcriptional regulator
MTQITRIVKLVKQQLKASNHNYADIAAYLGLSEASIKRMFSQQDFSLSRLEAICELLDMELLDVMYLARQQREEIVQLTLAQEQDIVASDGLMLVLICVLSHWRLEDMLNHYQLSKAAIIQQLLCLDKLGIIELLPNNKIKLRIASSFEWIPGGPIQRFFQQQLQAEFFNTHFKADAELFICKNGMLSMDKLLLLQAAMRKLAAQFLTLSAEDAHQPVAQRQGCALVLAVRPWVPALFDQYKR